MGRRAKRVRIDNHAYFPLMGGLAQITDLCSLRFSFSQRVRNRDERGFIPLRAELLCGISPRK
jgi:hypothetical protein